jgi:hypothetical protein
MVFHLYKRMRGLRGGKTESPFNIPDFSKQLRKHLFDWRHFLFYFLIIDYYFRNEHPIVPIIKEHRTLAKLLNSTLGSICSLARLSVATQKYTLHGHWLQTSTATGRLSIEEPNLQVWVLFSHVLFCLFLLSANWYI